jgi:hypothetical protein
MYNFVYEWRQSWIRTEFSKRLGDKFERADYRKILGTAMSFCPARTSICPATKGILSHLMEGIT